jgi:hypothetical protein
MKKKNGEEIDLRPQELRTCVAHFFRLSLCPPEYTLGLLLQLELHSGNVKMVLE